MSEQALVWKKEDGVCVITMNQPGSMNAISKPGRYPQPGRYLKI